MKKDTSQLDAMKDTLFFTHYARERKNRYVFLVERIKDTFPEAKQIPDWLIAEIIFKGMTDSRLINKAQQDRMDLRGEDYYEKTDLEREARLKLGYNG